MWSAVTILSVLLLSLQGSASSHPEGPGSSLSSSGTWGAELPGKRSEGERGIVTCTLCRNLVRDALGWLEAGDSRETMVEKATAICVNLGINNQRVCAGDVELNIDPIVWIITTKNESGTPLSPADVCSFALYRECPMDPAFEWSLDLTFLGPKPTPQQPQPPPEGAPTLKVLQFTDVHVDPNYEPGANAECGEPVCCRGDQGPPENGTAGAGFWGDYRRCDTPLHAFSDMLAEAAARHQDVAYVLFTGDIVDHAAWNTGEQYNAENIALVMSEIAAHFPDTPVIPILGNHEGHPCNVFTDPLHPEIPSPLQSTWLYELAAELWAPWLPPEAMQDVLAGGMFELQLSPRVSVIALNSMFCYSFNWWLMYDNVDPAAELTWLASRLLDAERAGRHVHVLAHLHSGSPDCMHLWSTQYRRIIDRFENTIVAQFHGHTHNDHFALFYDLEDLSRATNVAFIAGSGTAFADINPNYRVYIVDGDHPESSFRVLDHETWFYNLTEANLGGSVVPPRWQRLYRFTEEFGVTNLLPAQMDALVHRMANDTALQETYFRFYVKDGDAAMAEGCDATCLQQLVCESVMTVIDDTSKCDLLFPSQN